MIPESQDAKALSFQPCRALGIRANLVGVLPSVKLHNQPLFETDEINNVGAQWLLPAEFLPFQLS